MSTVAQRRAYDQEPPADDESAGRRPGGFDRIPPQDVDAERSVLGSMQLSKDAIAEIVEILKGRDFYRPAHETVWEAIIDLYSRGEPVDPITVADHLTKSGDLDKIGGASYLHTLIQSVPSAANGSYYATIVAEKATLRRLVEAATAILQLAYSEAGQVNDIVSAAQALLHKVTDENTSEDYVPLGDLMEGTLDEIEAIAGRDGSMTGMPTGFADLDRITQGLHGGQMVVIAARPAMGKSTLALDFARAMSIKHGHAGAFFSLEMGRNEIVMRLLSAEARVALHHMRSGTMTDDDWTRLARRMPDIGVAPLFIDDSPNLSMLEIRAKCRRLVQQHGIRFICIDYLQLMQAGKTGRPENRQQEVSDMSRNLKLMAKELGIPVIALSQLNRGPEQRADKKPMISDLRESGSIEQDADIVILLHREDAYEKESPRVGEADLILAKHRNGPTGTVTVAFQGHYSRFVDMAQT